MMDSPKIFTPQAQEPAGTVRKIEELHAEIDRKDHDVEMLIGATELPLSTWAVGVVLVIMGILTWQ